MTSDVPTSGALRTIERALLALDLISAASPPLSIRQLAQELDHNLSSTYNIVNTLIAGQHVIKDESGALHIGPRVAALAAAYDRDFSSRFAGYVDDVSRATGETVYLTAKERNSVVIKVVQDGSRSLRVAGLAVGFSGQEDQRASGKAVLAHLPPDDIAAIVARNHPDEPRTLLAKRMGDLEAALADVRREGFAFDDEEFEKGIVCVAAPIFDRAGEVVGSISASGAAVRREEFRNSVIDAVSLAAASMTRDLGGTAKNRFPAGRPVRVRTEATPE
jgi:DNA-binding IclR family transcriptional regulator